MRVCLLQPPYQFDAFHKLPPLGLAYLASSLRKNVDIDVVVLDLNVLIKNKEKALDKSIRLLRKHKPDIIGISAWTLHMPFVINLVRKYKEEKMNVPVILGGPHPSLDVEGTLSNCKADFVVRGEGEVTLVELIRFILNGKGEPKEIRGLSWKSKNEKIIHNPPRPLINNIDELPFPDFDLFPPLCKYQPYAEHFSLPILASRGCIYNCVFCSERKLWGGRIRKRTVNNIKAEIERDILKYRVKRLEFCDNTLNMEKNWLIKLCSSITKEKLDVRWHACMRLDRIDKSLISWLRKSGCVSILFGLESCVTSTLAFMKKGYPNSFTKKIMLKNIKATIESGIIPFVSFIIGFPCESEKDILQNIRFMTELRRLGVNVTVHLLCPEVGTEIKEKNKKNLVRNPLKWEHGELGMRFTDFTDDSKDDSNLYPDLFIVKPNRVDTARLLELYTFALCVTGNAPPEGIYI